MWRASFALAACIWIPTAAFAAKLECHLLYALQSEVEQANKLKVDVAYTEAKDFFVSQPLQNDEARAKFREEGRGLSYFAQYKAGEIKATLFCPSDYLYFSSAAEGKTLALRTPCAASNLPYELALGKVADYDPAKQDPRRVALYHLQCQVKN